jgi:NADH-ubiquinone oxidoreductase chain 5
MHAHDAPLFMAIPLIILCFGSIFIGYIMKDLIIGLGNFTFSNSIFIHPYHLYSLESEFVPFYFKIIPVFFSILGIIFALILNYFFSFFLYQIKLNKLGNFIFFFLTKK